MTSSVGGFSIVEEVGVEGCKVTVGDGNVVVDVGTSVAVSGSAVGNAGMIVPFSKYSRTVYIATARIAIPAK
jgi:hypothetical protein